ncbi:MAG: hypothetical protein KDK90_26145 [Leptospiraceae bacterium]|nr:hypothetical protein [Leptospiraceae bacterium]
MQTNKHNQLSLQEVQKYFEHPFISKRREFIETYNFHDDFKNYYKDVILKNLFHRDALYVCDLIELENKTNIKDEELLLRYLNLLSEKIHYLVKLEVLDLFLTNQVQNIPKTEIEKRLKNALPSYHKRIKQLKIVTNQILLNLIFLKTESLEIYKKELIKSLQLTKDHRSLIRTLHCLEQKGFSFLDKDYIQNILEVIKEQNQSRSVVDALSRFTVCLSQEYDNCLGESHEEFKN